MPDSNDIVFNQQTVDISVVFSVFSELIRNITGGGVDAATIFSTIEFIWAALIALFFLLGALFLFGFIYASIRFNQLAEAEMDIIFKQEQLWQQLYGAGAKENSRLADIEENISTDNPNDWKLAIIEADIILGQVLDKAGYVGATIGDQLKSASASAFQTLEDAWEAHKIRNQIAHQGADFILTHKVAKETVTRYKRVFAEFGVS